MPAHSWQVGWTEVGEGDAGIVVACATLKAMHREVQSLFEYLRSPLVENVAHETAFRDAFQLLLTELAFPKAGTPVLTTTLMKQCLIVLLRRYAEDGICRAPWLAARTSPARRGARSHGGPAGRVLLA